MTYTIELTPEMRSRLEQEAAKRGQGPSDVVAEALEMLLRGQEESADTSFADVRGMSNRSLQELWDNDEDAVYDCL